MATPNAPRGVLRYFSTMEDPRTHQGRRHDLLDMIVIALCAVICGADGWVEIEQFGHCKLKWFRTFLTLPHGIPSHDTFGRVFARLDPEQFERCFLNWIQSLTQGGQGRLVAIDGKTLRRSFDRAGKKAAIHMVSAWCQNNQMVLGQLATEAKSNEIQTVPKLLELLDLEGAVVTADALNCQKTIAAKTVAAQADYLLQVKGNQPALHEELKLLFEQALRDDCQGIAYAYAEETTGGHGRLETRRLWSTWEIDWFADRGKWKGLGSFVCLECHRQRDGQRTVERRYYLSSLDGRDAEALLKWVRGHWSIENQLHWSLDVSFREDDRRIRQGHAAEIYSRLCRIALNLLKADNSVKIGIKGKRLMAGWDHDYLLKLIIQKN